MILKLMGRENMADDDAHKSCQIIDDIQEARFHYIFTGEAALDVQYRKVNRGLTRETFVLKGNAYLMNDNGKTVQSFGCNHRPHDEGEIEAEPAVEEKA